MTRRQLPRAIIGVFWHNRILVVPSVYRRFCVGRDAVILTSASKDGAIIEGVMARFGLRCVRGSSSRRGGAAMRELITGVEAGFDIAITPDGPRGPVYKLGPGPIKLAQVTGAPVVPIHIHYSRYWELRSWDRFRIPKPFSRVKIVFETLHHIAFVPEGAADSSHDGELFEAERARIEAVLGNDEDESGKPCVKELA